MKFTNIKELIRAKGTKDRWRRTVRYFYLRFIRLKGTPVEISRGFAFGVFWGMFPLPGLQMAIAIVTAAIFRSSKLAAAAGTWLSNPLTTLPLTAFNLHVGQLVLRRSWTEEPVGQISPQHFLELGGELITSYLVGCFVVGLLAAIALYFVGVPFVVWIQERTAKRRLERKLGRRKRHYNG